MIWTHFLLVFGVSENLDINWMAKTGQTVSDVFGPMDLVIDNLAAF
jgi:hypothetical protein